MTEIALNNKLAYLADPLFIKYSNDKVFGFWIYLMSDCVLFAALFATFAIFSSTDASQQTPGLFNLSNAFLETCCLLFSTFTLSLAMHAMLKKKQNSLIFWLVFTFILGSLFIFLEVNEFLNLINAGNGPNKNSYLSSFFTLIGTHGLHVCCGLIWIAVMITQVLRKGLLLITTTRLILLSLFWHFLDIIWIGIFSFVYLLGAVT